MSQIQVKLVNFFPRPLNLIYAAARTCYSRRGIVDPENVDEDKRDSLVKFLKRAGHLTTFQHVSLQYAISGVSRYLIWSLLHSHPFYNSDQVSQRYVEVKPGSYYLPEISGEPLEIYRRTVEFQSEVYRKLTEMLIPPVESELLKRFRYMAKRPELLKRESKKRAMEVARYVLPIGTLAYLYHTINLVTLLRYWKLRKEIHPRKEAEEVVNQMVSEFLRAAPEAEFLFDEEFDGYSETTLFPEKGDRERFVREFDSSLEGRASKLIGYKENNEKLLADSVREVLGLSGEALKDEEAIALAMDPARNGDLAHMFNLTYHSRIQRAMAHVSYTFRKKLSHTADSQEQRHRTAHGSRPCLLAHFPEEPDYITPALIKTSPEIEAFYRDSLERLWDMIGAFERSGGNREYALYLLPNALSIRYTESIDLLGLRHKMAMRLCYNAQEEIWRATLDEKEQIEAVNPTIGKYLLPPCSLRYRAGLRPYCPEGKHYCGVKVWLEGLKRSDRVI